jgi:hypothetical protein
MIRVRYDNMFPKLVVDTKSLLVSRAGYNVLPDSGAALGDYFTYQLPLIITQKD